MGHSGPQGGCDRRGIWGGGNARACPYDGRTIGTLHQAVAARAPAHPLGGPRRQGRGAERNGVVMKGGAPL